MPTITLTDEQLTQVQDIINKAGESKGKEDKKKTIIYKTDGSVLYESDKGTIKEAVVKAIVEGVSLWRANLREANLGGANLREANLVGANLVGANLEGADMMNAKFYGRGGTVKLKKNQVEDFLNALGFQVEE